MNVVTMARISHSCYEKLGVRGLAQLFKNLNRVIYACDIAYQVELDKSVILPHQGLGVVMHPGTKIGKNCTIFQNTTFGAKHNGEDPGTPIVGDNVMIGCGAVLLGSIHIGNNVVIAANAVVLSDVPDNCTAAGAPAKIIKRRTNA